MPEFGDELIIESYKLPWLIWIQLLVTFLLILLLFFGFTIFTPDTSPTAAPPSIATAAAPSSLFHNPNSSHRRPNAEVHRVSRNDVDLIREENENGEESSSKDSMFCRIFQNPTHPCNYVGAVKRAFFKCFGLDSGSDLSDSHRHEKQE